jgi:hypothetical protein
MDQEAAKSYIDTVIKNEESVFRNLEKSGIGFFIITPGNLDTMLKDKDYSKYSLFYEKHYKN